MPPTSNGNTVIPLHSRVVEQEDAKTKKLENGSAPSSAAPTPPPKQKFKEPPPLPSGKGLLSGTPFGIGASSDGSVAPKGSNIWLSFELKGKENVTINFAHEVESKYGLSALNPRLAARKERQRQVALASSELEKAAGLVSADDMSIDQSEPESNNDTDVVMKDNEAPAPGKRRKRKAEDYDRNDEFIDDAELLLEEQALMAKDGFFVYSGPLLEEGERPAIERFVLSILFVTIFKSNFVAEPTVLYDVVVVVAVADLLVAKPQAADLEVVVVDLEAAQPLENHALRRLIAQ
jgi:HPC2/ubinuclein domain-containing protein